MSKSIIFYKITKIAERCVCIRVCKHSCDVKMFCCAHTNLTSTYLKKVLSLKLDKFTLLTSFPSRLKLEKSLETYCINFFCFNGLASEKILYFGKHLFCITKTNYARKTLCTMLWGW